MTGATLKALNPVIANQQRAAGLNSNPGLYNNFITWQVGFTFQMPLGMRYPLANTRQAQYILLRSRAYLQQVVHQTTHSLARFFLEIDANYKQFKTASRLRAAAAQRLDAQRAFTRKAGSRSTASSTRSASTRRPSRPRPSTRRRTTSRSSPWKRPRAPCWPTTISRWPKARTRGRRTSRPATSRMPIGSSRSAGWPDGARAAGRAGQSRVRPTPIRRPTRDEPFRLPDMPAPIGPAGPSPTPVPPHVPTPLRPFALADHALAGRSRLRLDPAGDDRRQFDLGPGSRCGCHRQRSRPIGRPSRRHDGQPDRGSGGLIPERSTRHRRRPRAPAGSDATRPAATARSDGRRRRRARRQPQQSPAHTTSRCCRSKHRDAAPATRLTRRGRVCHPPPRQGVRGTVESVSQVRRTSASQICCNLVDHRPVGSSQ